MKIEVCLTPELIGKTALTGKTVVVIDIFRATSCMVTGLANGVQSIFPVATVEECIECGRKGMITAGERDGKKIEAFDMGNSPFDYMKDRVKNRDVAVSTTNGTLAISKSLSASEVLIGAFLNIGATADYVMFGRADLILHCGGWRGAVNLEDTLFAGAMIARLGEEGINNDSAYIAHSLFLRHKDNLLETARNSEHAKRLSGFGIKKDIEFCMRQNVYDAVVRREGPRLVRASV